MLVGRYMYLLLCFVCGFSEEVERKFNDAKEKLNLLDKKIKRKHQSEKRVLTAIKAIQNEFAGAFQKFDSDMLDLIDHRFCQEDFDVNHTNGLFLYQRKVLEFLDEEKSKVLDELNEKFKKIYDEAQNHIISKLWVRKGCKCVFILNRKCTSPLRSKVKLAVKVSTWGGSRGRAGTKLDL